MPVRRIRPPHNPRRATACEPLEPRRLLAAAPQLVADINHTPADSKPSDMVEFRGALYYANTTVATGRELWRTDGTDAGTMLVADIEPGPASSGPSDLTVVGDTLFFTAGDNAHGVELWKSDGTPEGTTMVADVNPGAFGTSYYQLTAVNGSLMFLGFNSFAGGLWKSDGTPEGTVLLRPFEYDSTSGPPAVARFAGAGAVIGQTFYFRAFDRTYGSELWSSDGTPEGTALVKDVRPGSLGSYPGSMAVSDVRLLFLRQRRGARHGVVRQRRHGGRHGRAE